MIAIKSLQVNKTQTFITHPCELYQSDGWERGASPASLRKPSPALDLMVNRWVFAHGSVVRKRMSFVDSGLSRPHAASWPRRPRWKLKRNKSTKHLTNQQRQILKKIKWMQLSLSNQVFRLFYWMFPFKCCHKNHNACLTPSLAQIKSSSARVEIASDLPSLEWWLVWLTKNDATSSLKRWSKLLKPFMAQ